MSETLGLKWGFLKEFESVLAFLRFLIGFSIVGCGSESELKKCKSNSNTVHVKKKIFNFLSFCFPLLNLESSCTVRTIRVCGYRFGFASSCRNRLTIKYTCKFLIRSKRWCEFALCWICKYSMFSFLRKSNIITVKENTVVVA